MYICLCAAVTDRQIRATVEEGATTLDDLRCELGVAMCCGTCAHAAESLIAQTRARMADGVPVACTMAPWTGRSAEVRRTPARTGASGEHALAMGDNTMHRVDSGPLGGAQLEMA